MNRFCSMFSQILQLFRRSEFQVLVKETKAERHARGFSCWGQFIAMMFCQLGRAHSLRGHSDIEHCPNCSGSLKLIAAIEDPPVIDRILSHLGLPSRAPLRAPAQQYDLFQTV